MILIILADKFFDNDEAIIKSGLESETSNETVNKQEQKKLSFKDYVSLPPIFWVFSITAFLFYVSILSFISMSM